MCAIYGKRNILSAIKPITYFSSWVYFNSFGVKDDKIFVSRFKSFASVCFIIFCFLVKCLRMVWYSYPGFEQLIVNLITCFLITFWLASSLNCLVKSASIARLWNELLPLSRFITEDAFYRKAFRLTCSQLIGFNSMYAIYISLYYYFYSEDFQSLSHCLESFIDYCILMHFCGMEAFFCNGVYFGTKLVSMVNEDLKKLKRIEYYNDCKHWKGLDFIKSEKVTKLRSQLKMIREEDLSPLVDIYERLCCYLEELNECFGISLTASCLNNLTQMTLSCYFMIKHGWDAVKLFSIWLSYCFVLEWKLLEACENFTKETKRTGHITDLVVTDCSSKNLKDAIRKFSSHLLHRPVKFTACRLFDLNYRLLCSIVTSTITYLVIVIQFDTSRNFDTI